MEHEVNVPFSVGSVRAALAEPERVARCVPGLQLASAESAEAGTEGRLRVRIGNSTITYRGSLTVTPRGEEFAVEGSGTEARGTGSVRLNLTVVPRRSEEGDGTRLVCTGTVRGEGRIEDVDPKAGTAAGQRLLERFGKALGDSIQEDPPQVPASTDESSAEGPSAEPSTEAPAEPSTAEPTGGIGEPGDNERVIPGIPGPDTTRESGTTGADEEARAAEESAKESADESAEERPEGTKDTEGPERQGVFETEVPPPSLDPLQDEEAIEEAEAKAEAEAEAAHARRTMIGRSAEEVDHAPPRGRYAPVPVPAPIANSAALRWIAPAAAAVVAGAVVIGRVLRRRR
jgi:carbon monoxide dehydrogenase subunit G